MYVSIPHFSSKVVLFSSIFKRNSVQAETELKKSHVSDRDPPPLPISSEGGSSDTGKPGSLADPPVARSPSAAGGTFRPELMVADPHCYECKVRYRDPKPADLVMYLHALKYAVSALGEWIEKADYFICPKHVIDCSRRLLTS